MSTRYYKPLKLFSKKFYQKIEVLFQLFGRNCILLILIVISSFFGFKSLNALSQESLTIQDSISAALANNLSVKSAEEKVKIAEHKVNEARAAMMPSVSGSGSYTYMGKLPEIEFDFSQMFPAAQGAPSSEGGTGSSLLGGGASSSSMLMGNKHSSQVGISAQQALFTWGKIINAYRQAKLSLEAEKQGLESIRQQVIFGTTSAFYGVLLAEELVKVTEMAVDQVNAHVKMAQDLVDTGMATNFDLLRAKVQQANIRSQLIKMQNMLKLAKDGFKNTIGMNLDAQISLSGEFVYKPVEFTLDKLLESAMADRPEIRQLKLQEEIGEKIIKLAKAGNKPNIAAVYNYSYQSNEDAFGDVFKADNWKNTWSVTMALSLPIFDGLGTRAKVKQARGAVRQIQIGKEQLINGIGLEVRSAFSSFEEAEELLKVQDETIQQAQESLRIANLRYKNGMITSIELMDTELALTQAQTNYSNALNDYVIAIARIKKAIGSKEIQ